MAAHVVDDDPAERNHIESILPTRPGMLGLGDIVTHSPSMERVRRLAERAARSSIPVLVEGERGVGKELLARAIHGSSPRRSRPFVTARCESTDAGEIECVLFGEAADSGKSSGKLREASGGTLFVDEIGALPKNAQARLALSFVEGDLGRHAVRGDVRLIAATSRRLIDLVSRDGFDERLFNRLNVLPIWLPPLRERRADIPDLARALLARLAGDAAGSAATAISPEAVALLVAENWPGNIRELERAVFHAVMLSKGGELVPQDFPHLGVDSAGEPYGAPTGRVRSPTAPHAGVADQEQVQREGVSGHDARADRQLFTRYGVARLLDERGEMRPIGVLEEEVIRFAIGHYRGRMSEVARRLGIGRSTLYRKIKDYGIALSEPVAS